MSGWLYGKPTLPPTHGSPVPEGMSRVGVGGHRATILPTTIRCLTWAGTS